MRSRIVCVTHHGNGAQVDPEALRRNIGSESLIMCARAAALRRRSPGPAVPAGHQAGSSEEIEEIERRTPQITCAC